MKIVSAGTVILVGGRQVLLGHVTNSGNKWDLPKGKIDKGEIRLILLLESVMKNLVCELVN